MMKKLMQGFYAASEPLRTAGELGALYTFWNWIKHNTPAGTNKPVLLLPGIMNGDTMMGPLRDALAEKGYAVHGWQGGINTGFNEKTAKHLQDRLREVYESSGRKKVTLVGHSLGGLFARELAREFPDMVESVITLGSPFGMKEHEVPEALMKFYQFINPKGDPRDFSDKDLQNRRLTPPPVPTTSVFSRADGVVPWQACLNPKTPLSENIEIDSSHSGMIYHPLAVTAIIDRLAQNPATWQAFNPAQYSTLYGNGAKAEQIPDNPEWRHNSKSRPVFRKNP